MKKSVLQKKSTSPIKKNEDKGTQCADVSLSNVKFIPFTNCFPKIQSQQNLLDKIKHTRTITKYEGCDVELNSRIFLLQKMPSVLHQYVFRNESQINHQTPPSNRQRFMSRRSDLNTSRLPEIQIQPSLSMEKLQLILPRQKTQVNEALESTYQQSVLKGLKESISGEKSFKIKRRLISQESGLVRKISMWSNDVLQNKNY